MAGFQVFAKDREDVKRVLLVPLAPLKLVQYDVVSVSRHRAHLCQVGTGQPGRADRRS